LLGITNAGKAAQVLLFAMLIGGAVAAPAQAAFPGANGEIAYSWEEPDGETIQICTTIGGGPEPFGCLTGVQQWPDDLAYSADGQKIAYWETISDGLIVMDHDGSNPDVVRRFAASPAWSPTALGKIVFHDYGDLPQTTGLATINADGTGFVPLTTNGTDFSPDWSSDGSKIAFERHIGGNWELFVIVPDTEQELRLTTTPVDESSPDFSPDGSKLVFSASGQLHTMNADGTGRTPLPVSGVEPSWSPDGQKIVYRIGVDLYVANANGTGQTPLNTNGAATPSYSSEPDWRPLPVNTPSTHVRPAGATPFRASLVPAFNACTAPNRTHGPPLAFGSCAAPVPGSPNLTVGVGDGSPAFSRSVGLVRMVVHPGVPGGVDDTDVGIRFRLSNVMNVSDLSEYTGELRASVQVRLTDREGAVSSTTQNFPLEFDVPCVGTTPTIDKSFCELTTTLDAVRPGAAAEGTRAIWALDQLKVYDGGPDGDAGTTADNSLFAVQGVFVP
jgi:hypothetical protein